MFSFFYNIAVHLYVFAIRLASMANAKAKQWITGRSGQFARMKAVASKHDRIIWFHCASLGEFEQAKPVIEAVKNLYPGYKILLTVFSPSAIEQAKRYPFADLVFFLPSDKAANAKKFVNIFRPKLAVFVKYEFWYNYINELYKRKIPLIMISAIFRPGQYFFKHYGGWFRGQLNKVTCFFVQNESSSRLLEKAGIHHYEIAGDTRFDRVISIAEQGSAVPGIKSFKGDALLLVAGSTWPADEEVLLSIMKQNPGLKTIIAPHEIHPERIREIKERFSAFRPLPYSTYEKESSKTGDVLIIDSIGLLSRLYRYADAAYVGGGFGAGIHNLAEAAVYGVPVMFGPNHKRFREATELLETGGGFTFSNRKEAVEIAHKLFNDPLFREAAGKKAADYIYKNKGATQSVVEKIKEYLVVGSETGKTATK